MCDRRTDAGAGALLKSDCSANKVKSKKISSKMMTRQAFRGGKATSHGDLRSEKTMHTSGRARKNSVIDMFAELHNLCAMATAMVQ